MQKRLFQHVPSLEYESGPGARETGKGIRIRACKNGDEIRNGVQSSTDNKDNQWEDYRYTVGSIEFVVKIKSNE